MKLGFGMFESPVRFCAFCEGGFGKSMVLKEYKIGHYRALAEEKADNHRKAGRMGCLQFDR